MLRHPRVPLALLTVVLAASLVSSCVFVRVEGEIPEAERLTRITHGGVAPAGFQHGKTEFSVVASLFTGLEADVEMEFVIAADELDDHFERVCAELERELVEEEKARITRVSSNGPRQRRIEFDGEDGHGRVDVRIVERPAGSAYPYRLVIDFDD